MNTPDSFSAIFYKGDNFCDFSEAPSENGSTLKRKNLPPKGGKNNIVRVSFPESVSVPLNPSHAE